MLHRSTRRLTSSTEALFAFSKHWNLNYPSREDIMQKSLRFSTPPAPLPIFQVLSLDGSMIENPCCTLDTVLTQSIARRILSTMIQQSVLDKILHDCQRQGRVSFYLTSDGEAASIVGSAAALDPSDVLYGQYRESAALLYRGFPIDKMIAQCVGSIEDPSMGRQMPIHYGSKTHHFHTISSPVGTQLTQAAGCGYGMRISDSKQVCLCYFGEGTASEGDFHAALNMAATLRCRTLFFCRNNGFAISTKCTEQYAGDGIAGRGSAYGIPAIRVDGNDALAVLAATVEGRKLCVEKDTPVLIEAMTYRSGDHSTSDDASQYRGRVEKNLPDPIERFARYLGQRSWWEADETHALQAVTKEHIQNLLRKHEDLPKHSAKTMLEHVYDVKPPHLVEQAGELGMSEEE